MSANRVEVPQDFAARVVAWQGVHGRHGLPWQNTRDAYRIWLSEIMLQQTQVTTVLRYYGRFLERFPTVQALAQAPADEVLAAWSGLGYYSRARNLHACAHAVCRDHGGVFPTSAEVLALLPGIGRSTAAAVAAFSSGQRRAILDGNVKRVLTRHRAFEDDVSRPEAMRALWALAEALLPERGVEAYTQGLMDLGATVCVLRRPQCGQCPVQADCRAHAQGRATAFPVKVRRVKRGARESVLLLAIRDGGDPRCSGPGVQVWMERRPATGIWAGLWCLPLWDTEADLRDSLANGGWGDALDLKPMRTVEHALTHLDWVLRPLRLDHAGGTGPDGGADYRWMRVEEALALGLPAPIRRLLEDLLA